MKNRSQMSREELLAEIEFAEAILDGCGADEGLTLWGRIASIKPRLTPLALDRFQREPAKFDPLRGTYRVELPPATSSGG